MRPWRILLGNERRVARALSLLLLPALAALLLASLSASALEPRISRDIADPARARHLAEAGIEIGFNMLINTADFSQALVGANAGAPWVALVNNATLSGVTTGGASAGTAVAGTYSVVVRNDYQNADSALTGQSSGTDVTPNETVNSDSNRIVIMRSTGTFNGIIRTIEVVVRRAELPPFPQLAATGGTQASQSILSEANSD
jgi:Tfp pilus assembly protein PilX